MDRDQEHEKQEGSKPTADTKLQDTPTSEDNDPSERTQQQEEQEQRQNIGEDSGDSNTVTPNDESIDETQNKGDKKSSEGTADAASKNNRESMHSDGAVLENEEGTVDTVSKEKSKQDEDLVQQSDGSNPLLGSVRDNGKQGEDLVQQSDGSNPLLSIVRDNGEIETVVGDTVETAEPQAEVKQSNERLRDDNETLKEKINSLEAQNNGFREELSRNKTCNKTLEERVDVLEQENNDLQRELKGVTDQCRSLNQHYGEMSADRFIRTLHKELQDVTGERDELIQRIKYIENTHQEQLEAAEKSKASLEKQAEKAMNDRDIVKQRYTDMFNKERNLHQEEVSKMKSDIKSQKTANELLNTDNKKLNEKIKKQDTLIGRFEKDRQKLKSFEELYRKVIDQNKELRSVIQDLQPYKEVHPVLQQQLLEQDKKLEKCENDVQNLKEEKQTLLLRLSKVAGANLTHNNPNIADLSDEKRPTKLAEEFSELYDNEWTDAFEELHISDEEQKTTYMLNLLQRANQLCRDVSTKHSQDIRNSISSLTVRMLSVSPVRKHEDDSLSDETSHETNQYYDDNENCQRESDVNDYGDKTDSGEVDILKRDKEKSIKKGHHELRTTIVQPSESGKHEAVEVKRDVTTRDETTGGVKKETTTEEINKMTGEEPDGKTGTRKDETTESEIKQTTKGKGDKRVQKGTNRPTVSTPDVTVTVGKVESGEVSNDETNDGDEDDSPRSEQDQQVKVGNDSVTKFGKPTRSNSTKNEIPKRSKPETIQNKSNESFEPDKMKTKEDDEDLMFQNKNNHIPTDEKSDIPAESKNHKTFKDAVIEDEKEETNKSGNNATTEGEKDVSHYSGKHESIEDAKDVITENANGELVKTEKHITDGQKKVIPPSKRHETTEYHKDESDETEENESFRDVHPDKTGVQTDVNTIIEDPETAGVKTDVITKTENPYSTETSTEGKGSKKDVIAAAENPEATEVRTDANTSTGISETSEIKAGKSKDTEFSETTENKADVTTNSTNPETTEKKQDVNSEHNESPAGKTDGTTNNENHQTAEDRTDLTSNSKIHKTTEIETEVPSNSRQYETTGVKLDKTINSGQFEAKTTQGESGKKQKNKAYEMETDGSNAANVEINRVQAADIEQTANPGKTTKKPEDKDVGDGKAPQKPEDKDVGDGKAPQKPEDKDVGNGKVPQKPEDKDMGDGKEDLGEISAAKKMKLKSNFELLRNEQKKTIMDARRFFEKELAAELEKAGTDIIIREQGIHAKEQETVVLYIQKCINICWSMYRHDPPVHVEFSDITENIPFDTNKFKPYTKSGKYIDHIVWPSLQLHEGGPLLCKGVAQGRQVKK